MTIALVDDGALGAVLQGKTPRSLRRFDLATTGYWYLRLCQAVLGTTDRHGVLSKPFTELPEPLRSRALSAVFELPDDIALVSLRHLAPIMGRFRHRHPLNVLGLETLAAAVHLPAEVFLSAPSPRLQAALADEGRQCRVLRS